MDYCVRITLPHRQIEGPELAGPCAGVLATSDGSENETPGNLLRLIYQEKKVKKLVEKLLEFWEAGDIKPREQKGFGLERH